MARYKRCEPSGKMRFPNLEEAVHSALATSRIRATPLRPYRCPDCGDWHLTKTPGGRYVATRPGPFTPADMARLVARKAEA